MTVYDDQVELRWCRCADPESCKERVPGYLCKAGWYRRPIPTSQSHPVAATMTSRHHDGDLAQEILDAAEARRLMGCE